MSDLSVKIYKAIDDNDKPRDIRHWHASSIAKCPRALYFERKGVPMLKANEPGGGKKLRWRAGHALEGALRPALQTIYPKLLTNVRFTNQKLDLTGEFDGYDPETKTLISVKSVHDYAMITRNGQVGLKERVGTNEHGKAVYELKNSPYIHHEYQEHAYVLLMSNELTTNSKTTPNHWLDGYPRPRLTPDPIDPIAWRVENITYIYITLGGLVQTYTTKVNPKILERVTKKVDYLNKQWKANKAPICMCQEDKEMFKETNQYCDYRTDTGCCALKLQKEAVNV